MANPAGLLLAPGSAGRCGYYCLVTFIMTLGVFEHMPAAGQPWTMAHMAAVLACVLSLPLTTLGIWKACFYSQAGMQGKSFCFSSLKPWICSCIRCTASDGGPYACMQAQQRRLAGSQLHAVTHVAAVIKVHVYIKQSVLCACTSQTAN
jgi:hypothetical protein